MNIETTGKRKSRWKTAEPLELDGRTLEGGGQLIRNALCISALTGIPVKMHNIRGNRSSGGGLKAQHLACVNWLAHACRARVEGAEKGSRTLLFEPGQQDDSSKHLSHSPAFKKVMKDGEPAYECRLDIGTAGSTGLALQAILPFVLFAGLPSAIPTRLTLTGGTNVPGSPSIDYIMHVLIPTLQNIGLPKIEPKLGKRGWSQGGSSSIGSFTLEIQPRETTILPSFDLKPAVSGAKASKPTHLHVRFLAPTSCWTHFETVLGPAISHHFGKSFSKTNGNLDIFFEDSKHEKRLYLIIIATMPSINAARQKTTYKLGRDWLYDRKIRSLERTATEMAERVVNDLAGEVESGAFVDTHMRDQLAIFAALAEGTSEIYAGVDGEGMLTEPSLHARTAEWVAKKMLGTRFDAQGRCDGVGFGTDKADSPTSAAPEEDLERMLERMGISGT